MIDFKEGGDTRMDGEWLCFALLGMAWHGMAWHGMAWHGMAWLGLAWLGLLVSTRASSLRRHGEFKKK